MEKSRGCIQTPVDYSFRNVKCCRKANGERKAARGPTLATCNKPLASGILDPYHLRLLFASRKNISTLNREGDKEGRVQWAKTNAKISNSPPTQRNPNPDTIIQANSLGLLESRNPSPSPPPSPMSKHNIPRPQSHFRSPIAYC